MSQMAIEKEKLHTLEAAFENMRRQGKCPCILDILLSSASLFLFTQSLF